MRVLFTHSYFLRFDPKQWKQMQPYAPLGTLYAAALLRENGFEVAFHDVMFEESPTSLVRAIKSFGPALVVVYDDGFNYLTKMCLTNMREAAFEMCRLAGWAGCKVAVCSSDAADHAAEYLQQNADYIITGEGEQTLLELAGRLKNEGDNYPDIAGLIFRKEDGTVVRNMPRQVMHDLDRLPIPAWDLVDIRRYRQAWMKTQGYFSINMSTTRGCPFKCNWCAKPIYGNRYNVRSPQHVIKELLYLKDLAHFDHVWFCDDIFGLKPGWIQQFAELVEEAGLKFRFRIQSRADLLLHDGHVVPLAAAGCETVWIGAESGSQKILDAMDKGISIGEIGDATKLLRKHNIRVAHFIQFGYLGETGEDIDKTLKMIKELKPDDIGISVSYPLPGTKFYEKVKDQLQQKANWTDSDDLDMMFRSSYDTAFYRNLHRYVHAYFRKIRSIADVHFSWKGLMRIPYYLIRERWQRRLIKIK